MSSVVTQHEHQVQGDIGEVEDTEDVIEDPEPESQIQDSNPKETYGSRFSFLI